MRVLVTGGAGFIGSHFSKMALRGELGDISFVRIIDKFTYSGLRSNLESIQGLKNFLKLLVDSKMIMPEDGIALFQYPAAKTAQHKY